MTTPGTEHTLIMTRNATDIIMRIPMPCPLCGRVTQWYRNHEGRTRCINCTPTPEGSRAA